MRLIQFISANTETILQDWLALIRTSTPAAGTTTAADDRILHDEGSNLLEHFLQCLQVRHDAKAPDVSQRDNPSGIDTATNTALAHERRGARTGLELCQFANEHRILRTTVLKRWNALPQNFTAADLEDVIVFNDVVDQCLAESLWAFADDDERARQLLIGVLGHDLRTPLSTIANCAQLAMRTRPGEIRETQMILRGVAQMKMLVDDLVEYTRDRLATGAKIEREKIQLDVFVKDLLAEINSIHPDRKISFVAQGSGQGDWDKARLRQLVTNLVGNALKFSERESAIAVSLDGSADDAIALAVQSCGPPVPGALLPAFFEPSPGPRGAEVPVHRRGVNAGLGLHIAREIVAAHGGTITLASGDKTGTRFEVLLPRSSSPSARDR